jgi:hypothetical protein
MNSIPKAILATAIVAMFLAGMMVVPSYSVANITTSRSNTQHNTVAPEKAQKCPNGDLAPNNDVSQCPPLISTAVPLNNRQN